MHEQHRWCSCSTLESCLLFQTTFCTWSSVPSLWNEERTESTVLFMHQPVWQSREAHARPKLAFDLQDHQSLLREATSSVTHLCIANAAVEQPAEVQKGSLLMSEEFTDEMMELYSPVRHKQTPDSKPVMPQTSRSFPVKFLNIMDPLLPTNNLGRSVSKASFARIRKALAHGAKSLSGIVAKVCCYLVSC